MTSPDDTTNPTQVRPAPAWRTWLLRFLGLALAAGLLTWTITRTGANPLEALKQSNKIFVFIAFACIVLVQFVGAYRWGRLLSVHGIHLPFWQLVRLTFAGMFISQFIPGAISGDILKIACVVRPYPGKGIVTTMACVLDRVVGVSGLFVAAGIGGGLFWALHPDMIEQNANLQLALRVVIIGGIATMLALIVLVCNTLFLKIGFIRMTVQWFDRHLPKKLTGFVTEVCQAADAYKRYPGTLFATLLLSMTIHSLLGTALFYIGRAIGETLCSFGIYFLNTQVSNAVTVLPLTPGGLGLRDSVSAALFNSIDGIDTALMGTIPIVYSIVYVFVSLGGAFPIKLNKK